MATGNCLHDSRVQQWADARTQTENTEAAADTKCQQKLGTFQQQYNDFKAAHQQCSNTNPEKYSDKPYAKELSAQAVPVTTITYQLDGKEYKILIAGKNHVVAASSIPTQMQGYELTEREKSKLAMSYRSRLRAYAILAAYIFQCDGINAAESKVLQSMVTMLKLSPSGRKKFMAKLSTYNSEMPYEKLRKLIKPILKSNKTITFAWQCMAVDKKITEQEKELFNNIVAEFNLSSEEVERLKKRAYNFARLKPDQIAIEYVGITPEIVERRKQLIRRNIAIALFSTIFVVIAAIIFFVGKLISSENDSSADYIDTAFVYEDSIESSIYDEKVNDLDSNADADASAADNQTDEESNSQTDTEANLSNADVLYGTVGRYSIEMKLKINSMVDVTGSYRYTNSGGGGSIPLSGSMASGGSGACYLTEEYNGKVTGTWELNISSDASGKTIITGTMTNYKGQTFPVNLSGNWKTTRNVPKVRDVAAYTSAMYNLECGVPDIARWFTVTLAFM